MLDAVKCAAGRAMRGCGIGVRTIVLQRAILPAMAAAALMAVLWARGPRTPRSSPFGMASPATPTYTQNVAPILYAHCVLCHHPNYIAPMSLLTYADAKLWADTIQDRVDHRIMPPWFGDPADHRFANDPRLSAGDIATIDRWVMAGEPEGPRSAQPPVPQFKSGWSLGKPDLVFAIPNDFVKQPGADQYLYFRVPTHFAHDVWVRAADLEPGNYSVVHHSHVFIETPKPAPAPTAATSSAVVSAPAHGANAPVASTSGASAAPAHGANAPATSSAPIAPASGVAAPGAAPSGVSAAPVKTPSALAAAPVKIDWWKTYSFERDGTRHFRPDAPIVDDGCSMPNGGMMPDEDPEKDTGGLLASYLPGKGPDQWEPGYAKRIPAGATLVFQVHYHNGTTKPLRDRSQVALYLAPLPVEHEVRRMDIHNYFFELPAGDSDVRVTACHTLEHDIRVISYVGHMHYRGNAFRIEADFPDGHRETLVNVPHYDFHWQQEYRLKQPQLLPRGTRLMMIAHFDNSAANYQNPNPRAVVRWGEPSDEEMMDAWFEYYQAP
jgi:hypothetical protein